MNRSPSSKLHCFRGPTWSIYRLLQDLSNFFDLSDLLPHSYEFKIFSCWKSLDLCIGLCKKKKSFATVMSFTATSVHNKNFPILSYSVLFRKTHYFFAILRWGTVFLSIHPDYNRPSRSTCQPKILHQIVIEEFLQNLHFTTDMEMDRVRDILHKLYLNRSIGQLRYHRSV